MANPEHLAILKQGVEKWNKWSQELPSGSWPDLSAADLSGSNLNGANLHGADLRRANLTGTHLRDADLGEASADEANLSAADLRQANLRSADFSRANLSRAVLLRSQLSRADLGYADLSAAYLNEADLRLANLSEANLSEANLLLTDFFAAKVDGADFARATSNGTHFADLDLSAAKGLETIHHEGPSTVGIDTIYRSQGKIPEAFLRGCGVPENFIEYMHSLTGQAFEYYSCFISYSTLNQEFAERLCNDLQGKNVRRWFAPHDVQGGRKLDEQIDEAIRQHDKLLLILSDDSMQSEWVKTEIAKARKRETKQNKRVLFPVRLVSYEVLRDWECFDADTGKDSAREIREYFIPDFSNWKDHDSYQSAFARLLKDLKAEASR